MRITFNNVSNWAESLMLQITANEDDTLMTERLHPVFNQQSVMGINICQLLLLEGLDISLNQGFKNPGRRVGRAIEFRKVENSIFGSPK